MSFIGNLPRTLGRYRLISHIATGGMGHVYLAALEGPGGFTRHCVIKTLMQSAEGEDLHGMFANEARVLGLIQHPSIVQVLDFGEADGEYFIALEWVDGTTLYRLLREAWRVHVELGPRVAIATGVIIAEALAYAHALTGPAGPLGLVHRDVTPGNLLIARNGAIKLADFGIVKLNSSENKTSAGVIKGKFAYMSPEQASAEPLDGRSDVFSLGIVLWELVAGKHLFRRSNPTQELVAAATADVPSLTTIVKDVPEELDRIIMCALAKEREFRYPDAAAMQADLEALRKELGHEPPADELRKAMEAVRAAGGNLEVAKGPTTESSRTPSSATPSTQALIEQKESPALIVRTPIMTNSNMMTRQPTQTVPLPIVLSIAAAVLLIGLFWIFLLAR